MLQRKLFKNYRFILLFLIRVINNKALRGKEDVSPSETFTTRDLTARQTTTTHTQTHTNPQNESHDQQEKDGKSGWGLTNQTKV